MLKSLENLKVSSAKISRIYQNLRNYQQVWGENCTDWNEKQQNFPQITKAFTFKKFSNFQPSNQSSEEERNAQFFYGKTFFFPPKKKSTWKSWTYFRSDWIQFIDVFLRFSKFTQKTRGKWVGNWVEKFIEQMLNWNKMKI